MGPASRQSGIHSRSWRDRLSVSLCPSRIPVAVAGSPVQSGSKRSDKYVYSRHIQCNGGISIADIVLTLEALQ